MTKLANHRNSLILFETKNALPTEVSANFHIYRPQRSCGQGNIFTPVCHSVHRGVCLSVCWDTTPPPPRADTPRWSRTPLLPEQNPPPPGADTPRSRHPSPGSRLQHTVYERPVRILLECILVT